MQEKSDVQLLQEYCDRGCDAAFGELVMRYTDLIYSTAVRSVLSPDMACDIAQRVFVDLSRKAQPISERFKGNASLAGWLYRSTRFAALNQVRQDQRRRANERELMEQTSISGAQNLDSLDPLNSTGGLVDWTQIGPVLDEAMDALKDADREAVLLRFFKNQDFRAIGAAMGMSDDAAQKRVSRAVDRLRHFFARKGIAVQSSGLAAALAGHAVQAAPAGLTTQISAIALAGSHLITAAGGIGSISSAASAAKAITMTTLTKAVAATVLSAALGIAVYQTRRSSRLSQQIEGFRAHDASIAARAAVLASENQRLSNLVVEAKSSEARSQAQFQELMKLRGKAGLAQTYSREVQELKSALQEQKQTVSSFATNAMAMGLSTAQKSGEKDAANRLIRMEKELKLTGDQAEAIGAILTNHIRQHFQMTLDMMAGKKARGEMLAEKAGDAEEEKAEIRAALTPEQAAAYPQFLQAEKTDAAQTAAQHDTSQIAETYKLSNEQQDQLRSALFALHLKQADAPLQQTIKSAKEGGSVAEVVRLTTELQRARLDQKIKVLEPFLSSEQLAAYRQAQAEQIERLATAMKLLTPGPAETAKK